MCCLQLDASPSSTLHCADSDDAWTAGPCKDECRLEIFPKLDNGDACRLCGQQNHVWQNKAYAGLDVKASVNYTRDSMLIGTTVATFARDASKGLQAEGLQVKTAC